MLIKRLSARLQNHPKRLIYSDGADPRILQSARRFATNKLGVPILVGSRGEIESVAGEIGVRLDGIKIVEPLLSDDFPSIFKVFKSLPKFRDFGEAELGETLSNPIYFSTMMLATAHADAMVVGANSDTGNSLRSIFQIISLQKGFKTVSSMMIASTERPGLGIGGDLFMADCGVIAEPTEDQLSDIAITTAMLMNHFTMGKPKVAMLSCVTKTANTKLSSILKMKSATALARARILRDGLDIEIDGELQVDAAIRPDAALQKGVQSSVAGCANVLVFPDLNSGNIASKMLQLASNVNCYGQILTGITKPAAEISRCATTDDIFGTSVIVAAQAVDRRFMTLEDDA